MQELFCHIKFNFEINYMNIIFYIELNDSKINSYLIKLLVSTIYFNSYFNN